MNILKALPFLAGTSFLLLGCSADYYQKQADQDVYAILQRVENDIFGKSSDFSIKTSHSGQKPKSVTTRKILDRSSSGKTIKLSLDDAISQAIAQSREYQSQKERLYLSALTLTGERHRFKPNFFGRSGADYERARDGERSGTVGTDIGVDQALKTGGSLGISIANDLLRYFTGDPRRSAASVLNLNITQPLLRGAGRGVAAENLTQANRNVVYSIRDYAHFQNTFSVGIVTDYFDVLQGKDVILNEYSNYQSRKVNVEYLSARSDRESPESVGIAEQDELQAKNRYIRAITNYRTSLDRLKITLGLPQTTQLKLDDSEIAKLRKGGVKPLALGPNQAFRIALSHRLPLFNDLDRFEDRKRQVCIAANQLKADLNIVGSASLANNGEATDYTKFDFNEIRAHVGLGLNLPLDRLRERNQYRATLINFEASIRDLSLSFDELRNLLDRRIRELDQFRQSYVIQKNAVSLAKRRVEENQLRLKAGRVIFRRLSESQDALIAAQNSETSALVNYLQARLNLLLDLGVLDSGQEEYWLKSNPSKLKALNTTPQSIPFVTPDAKIPTPTQLFE